MLDLTGRLIRSWKNPVLVLLRPPVKTLPTLIRPPLFLAWWISKCLYHKIYTQSFAYQNFISVFRVFSDVMTTSCRTALLEIQYFVARDFRLDSQLYAQCKSDAAQYCNAAPNWTEEINAIGPQRNPLVLPCLYRYAYHPPAGSSVRKRILVFYYFLGLNCNCNILVIA